MLPSRALLPKRGARCSNAPLLLALLAAASVAAGASPGGEPGKGNASADPVEAPRGAGGDRPQRASAGKVYAAIDEKGRVRREKADVTPDKEKRGAGGDGQGQSSPRMSRTTGRKRAAAGSAALERDAVDAAAPAAQNLSARTSVFARLDESYFQPFDESKSAEDNARANFDKAFDKRIKTFNGNLPDEDVMTEEEVEDFKKRFIDEIGLAFWNKIKREPDEKKKHAMWMEALAQAMEDETPAVTERMVEKINADQSAGWHADKADIKNMSSLDMRSLLGVSSHARAAAALEEESADWFWSPSPPPSPSTLDLRNGGKWPQCKEAFSYVHSQGSCGSCWAFAAVGVANGQACIQGKFSGAQSYRSEGYLTSCGTWRPMWFGPETLSGCGGGLPSNALKYMGRSGIPTGGDGSNKATCVPYFGSGDSLKHFTQKGKAAACPSSCTSTSYQGSLGQDKLKISTLYSPVQTKSFDQARAWMYARGPISMAYDTYADFMSYRSGIYDYKSGAKQGAHAVRCVGYGSSPQSYVLCINSWTAQWGDRGSFKISATFKGIWYYDGPAAP